MHCQAPRVAASFRHRNLGTGDGRVFPGSIHRLSMQEVGVAPLLWTLIRNPSHGASTLLKFSAYQPYPVRQAKMAVALHAERAQCALPRRAWEREKRQKAVLRLTSAAFPEAYTSMQDVAAFDTLTNYI